MTTASTAASTTVHYTIIDGPSLDRLLDGFKYPADTGNGVAISFKVIREDTKEEATLTPMRIMAIERIMGSFLSLTPHIPGFISGLGSTGNGTYYTVKVAYNPFASPREGGFELPSYQLPT